MGVGGYKLLLIATPKKMQFGATAIRRYIDILTTKNTLCLALQINFYLN